MSFQEIKFHVVKCKMHTLLQISFKLTSHSQTERDFQEDGRESHFWNCWVLVMHMRWVVWHTLLSSGITMDSSPCAGASCQGHSVRNPHGLRAKPVFPLAPTVYDSFILVVEGLELNQGPEELHTVIKKSPHWARLQPNFLVTLVKLPYWLILVFFHRHFSIFLHCFMHNFLRQWCITKKSTEICAFGFGWSTMCESHQVDFSFIP